MAIQPLGQTPFAAHHRSDRTFFAVYLAIIWIGMVLGFGLDFYAKFQANRLHYPWVIHAHALAFGGWLLLFTHQVLAVRRGDLARHRRMGALAVLFLVAMVVLGPWASIAMDGIKFGHPRTAFPFMATQFTNVFGAAVLIVAGLLKRDDAAAHKRLMLMSILALMEPGLSRIFADPLGDLLGDGYWQYWVQTYIGSVVLMLGVGAYDLATRGRMHGAFVAALVWCLFNEVLATWLYYSPWWAGVTTRLLGH